tara:strand:- start:10626 stop:11135 length:510 start_codon:yes stop_codon:yes gene_type:complete
VNSNFLVVGHDPGMTGALALLKGEELLDVHRVQKRGPRIDVYAVDAWLRWVLDEHGSIDALVIEDLHGFQANTPTANWMLSRAESAVVTVADLMGLPMMWVTPLRWQKAILQGMPVASREQIKDSSRKWASEKYPQTSAALSVKASQDIADAICIAEMGRRLLNRGRTQ